MIDAQAADSTPQAGESKALDDEPDTTHNTTANNKSSSPHKRARKTEITIQRAGNRSTTSLKRIFDLPPEIFHEVASHLTPTELLFLARSNKFFRNIFMSRSSINVWRSAFGNVPDLPPCPPDLCEPQYASLLFSKTCSECGARVLRRMDAQLHVRLCNSCREEMVHVFGVEFGLLHLLPMSPSIFPPKAGHVFVLKRDWEDLGRIIESRRSDSDADYKTWQVNRLKELQERDQHAIAVERYLDKVDAEREAELLDLKKQRRDGVEARLLEEGWSKKDMQFPIMTVGAWDELVFQPKPLTDRIWSNLRPKLVPLLEANKAYHEEQEMKSRLQAREWRLYDMMSLIQQTQPPMVEVTVHAQELDESNTFESADPTMWTDDRSVRLWMPFPSKTEFLSWNVARELVGPDVPVKEMHPEMYARREALEREVVEWQEIVQRDMIDIYQNGRDVEEDQATDEPESSTTNHKSDTQVATRRSTRLKSNANPESELQLDPHASVFPLCTVVFTKGDGTTTTNIADLPQDYQTLLRADTVFRTSQLWFYPGRFPGTIQGIDGALYHGGPWEPTDVTRDDDASDIARALLRRLGRPEATYAEMKALGFGFSCQRCSEGMPTSWIGIVRHFAEEQERWGDGQSILSRLSTPTSLVFNNTHDVADPRPCIRLLAPGAAAALEETITERYSWTTTCNICKALGVIARYDHHADPSVRSEMTEHLLSAHEIQQPSGSVHFTAIMGPFDEFSEDE